MGEAPSETCERGGAGGQGPTQFFKELELRVRILSAQKSKLLLKYVKILPP